MSSSGAICFVLSAWLLLCESWNLPPECQPPLRFVEPPSDLIKISTTTQSSGNDTTSDPTPNPTNNPTLSPTPYPTVTTNSPTTSPTLSWNVACCAAINDRYYYDPDDRLHSPCTALHGGTKSCSLTGHSTISSINLRNCSLKGPIPPQLQYMTDLSSFLYMYA